MLTTPNSYEVDILRLNPSETVSKFEERRQINNDDSIPNGLGRIHTLEYDNLLPGTSYEILITPYSDQTNELLPADQVRRIPKTLCSCVEKYRSSNSDESNGAPRDVLARQNRGQVLLSWTDSSLCESGFSFTRCAGATQQCNENEGVAFTSDYIFANTLEKSCLQEHAPTDLLDSIDRSDLALGSSYTYCMRAVDERSRSVVPYASGQACAPAIVVQYEAILRVRFELEPTAGSLPVEKVQVSWVLGSGVNSVSSDLLGRSMLESNEEGEVEIHFRTDQFSSPDMEMQPITLYFHKTTGEGEEAVEHSFLCDRVDRCSSKTLELRHLQFDREYTVQDTTSVLFTGRVAIDGLWQDANRCPVADAEVCLREYTPSGRLGAPFVCAKTDDRGIYELPATLGTLVTPEVTFEQHSIIRDLEVGEEEPAYYRINAGVTYNEINFLDTQVERLEVELAGGKCNRFLGEATLEVSHGNCAPLQLDLPSWRRSFEVPAHMLDVKLTSVSAEGGADIITYLTDAEVVSVRVDLRRPDASEQEAEYEDAEQQQALDQGDASTNSRLARFEYHPRPNVNVRLLQQREVDGEPVYAENACPTVLSQRTPVRAEIEVYEEFASGQTCDWVEGEVVVTNQLGSSPEEAFLAAPAERAMLTGCRRPCKQTLTFDNPPVNAVEVECGGWRLVRSAWNPFSSEANADEAVVPANIEAQGQFFQSDDATIPYTQVMVECGSTEPGAEPITEYRRAFTIIRAGDNDARRSLRAALTDFNAVVWANTNEDDSQVDGETFVTNESVPDGGHIAFDPLHAQCGTEASGIVEEGVWSRMWIRNIQDVHPTLDELPGPTCESGEDFIARSVPPTDLPSRAHVDLQLMTGDLVELAPYTKPFTVSMKAPHQPLVETRVDVTLTGRKVLSEEFSVSLPSYRPLVVIRDPPGGLSSASYTNMRSTLSVDVEGYDHYAGVSSDTVIAGGAYTASEACIGALGLSFCQNAAGIDIEAHGGLDLDAGYGDYGSTSNTGSLDITWSYSTSDYDAVPGRQSDVFLVPSLNLKFSNTLSIEVDPETCAASEDTELIWQFEGDANQPSFAWLSHAQITDYEIPRIQGLLDESLEQQAELEVELQEVHGLTEFELADSDSLRDLGAAEEEGSDKQIAIYAFVEAKRSEQEFSEAVFGWSETIRLHDEMIDNVDDSLQQGRLAKVGGLVSPAIVEGRRQTVQGTDQDHVLIQQGLRNKDGSRTTDDDKEDIEQVNLITFSGGGATLSYDYSEGVGYSQGDGTSDSFRARPHAGFNTGVTGPAFKATIDFDVGIDVAQQNDVSDEHSTDEGTSLSFTLGDINPGDYFDVEVYRDTRYNTLAFRTTGGASKCPHEEGTFAREQPTISVSRRPAEQLFDADGPAVFELLVGNAGLEGDVSNFILRNPIQTNEDGLQVRVDGGSIISPLQVLDLGRESLPITVELLRGPEKFEYGNVDFTFSSLCEVGFEGDAGSYSQVARTTLTDINFRRPCPTVEFDGQLERDGSFFYNAESSPLFVQARNPTPLQPWTTAVELEELSLEVRTAQPGSVWRTAASVAKTGLASDRTHSFEWDASEEIDGDYELRLRTQCASGSSSYSSLVLNGRVDTRAPEHVIQGEVQDYMSGDEILFAYNEPLLCVEPRVFTAELSIRGYDAESDSNPDGTVVFTENQLGLLCEGSHINIGLPATIDIERAAGKRATLTLIGVRDLARNVQDRDVEYNFRFAHVQACVPVQLGLVSTSRTGEFRVNSDQASVTVQARNPNGIRWDETQGLTSVNIEIRPCGLDAWTTLADIKGLENSQGEVNFEWTPEASIEEGSYDIRARAVCEEDQRVATTIVRGMVDRTPPGMWLFEPRSGVARPLDPLVVEFNEDLACGRHTKPHAMLSIAGREPLTNDELYVLCEGHTVTVHTIEGERLVGSEGSPATLVLTNIRDTYGNARDRPVTQNFVYADNQSDGQPSAPAQPADPADPTDPATPNPTPAPNDRADRTTSTPTPAPEGTGAPSDPADPATPNPTQPEQPEQPEQPPNEIEPIVDATSISCGDLVSGSTVGKPDSDNSRWSSGDVVLSFVASDEAMMFSTQHCNLQFALELMDPEPPAVPASAAGFCGTEWSETASPEGATCIPCSTSDDCPTGRACWSTTFCQEGVLCGANECPGDNAARVLYAEAPAAGSCVSLTVPAGKLTTGKTYELVVEGVNGITGDFVLGMACGVDGSDLQLKLDASDAGMMSLLTGASTTGTISQPILLAGAVLIGMLLMITVVVVMRISQPVKVVMVDRPAPAAMSLELPPAITGSGIKAKNSARRALPPGLSAVQLSPASSAMNSDEESGTDDFRASVARMRVPSSAVARAEMRKTHMRSMSALSPDFHTKREVL